MEIRRELTYEEKNQELFKREVELLKKFLERNAISGEQYDKCMTELKKKIKCQPING